jgi:rubrerythrin
MNWFKREAISEDLKKKNIFKTDEENIARDIVLEQEAIDIYEEHINITTRPHVKALLKHIREQEKHHAMELRKQLNDLDEPLPKSDTEEKPEVKTDDKK